MCTTSFSDLDLIFDFLIVSQPIKIFFGGYILETVKCRKLMGRT